MRTLIRRSLTILFLRAALCFALAGTDECVRTYTSIVEYNLASHGSTCWYEAWSV